jgi:hypothetical protein
LGHLQWLGVHGRCLLLSHLRPRKAEGAISMSNHLITIATVVSSWFTVCVPITEILWFLQDATFLQSSPCFHVTRLDHTKCGVMVVSMAKLGPFVA